MACPCEIRIYPASDHDTVNTVTRTVARGREWGRRRLHMDEGIRYRYDLRSRHSTSVGAARHKPPPPACRSSGHHLPLVLRPPPPCPVLEPLPPCCPPLDQVSFLVTNATIGISRYLLLLSLIDGWGLGSMDGDGKQQSRGRPKGDKRGESVRLTVCHGRGT